ncbi:MAG: trypsin-like peptidase domain-containing protein [Chloroflexi bacterium]|nr:trypsin-like peptidase domain-containing protein [Chloroflexota bacterium]
MKRKMWRLPLILTVIILLLAGCTLPGIAPPAPSPAPPAGPPPPPINPSWTPPVISNNQSIALPNIADVVEKVKPSVVAITTEVVTLDFFNRPFTEEGAGSGWIIDEDGIIVTNNHVVEGARNITVTLDNGATLAVGPDSVFTDVFSDLAVLRVNASGLPALKTGDSSRMRIGDWVIAVGNALGQGIRATEGIVSRKGVSIPVSRAQTLFDLVETTAAINPGNSGGPLVNLAGEVIGITSAKIATIGVEGMGYAIGTETAIPILEALIKNGFVTRPWLGVVLRSVDEFVRLRFNLTLDKGVFITEVSPGSPADRAGLRAGDVITAIDGREMATADDLIRFIRNAGIGQTIKIAYWRDSTQNTSEATLAESPPP